MSKDIKMIGLDLDGTLLNSKKELTEETQRVLEEAIRKGVVVLPATGRPMTGIPKELREFPGIRYAITANGARIIDHGDGDKVLWESLIDYEAAEKILEISKDYDTVKEVCFDGQGYAIKGELDRLGEFLANPAMIQYMLSTRIPVDDLTEVMKQREGRPLDKLHFLFHDMGERKEMEDRVREIGDFSISGALGNNMEINAFGVHKGSGLLKLGEMLGITQEEIMGCGDGSNDLEMVEMAGLGVAMENAIPELKEVADYVTRTNDENGVAEAIRKFVL